MIEDWYEIWVDETPNIPYILLLAPNASKKGEFIIINVIENNRIVETFSNYELAELWLDEDEYVLVSGRMSLN